MSAKFVKELEQVAEIKIPYINEPPVEYSGNINNNSIKTLINTIEMLQKQLLDSQNRIDELLSFETKNKELLLEIKKLRAQFAALVEANKKVEIKKGGKQ